jgi:prepilin-type N-terminal cleavage/methylation domain-containing protein
VRRRVRRRAPGFTLLETLVALAVTAVVLTALATAVPAALRANEAARARLDRATAARAFLLHLERELASALAEPCTVAAEPATRLEFTGGTEPGARLAYTLEHGAVVRRSWPRFTAADPRTPGVPVLDGVAALSLDAWDGREWRTTWAANRPPEAVRVRLRFADGESAGSVATIPITRRRPS